MGESLKELLVSFFAPYQMDVLTGHKDQVRAFAFINEVENRSGKLRDALRTALLPVIESIGVRSDKAILLEGFGASVTLTHRRTAPTMNAVSELCAKKGIALDKATEAVTTIKVSVSKLEALVEHGLLSQDDLDLISGFTRVVTGELNE